MIDIISIRKEVGKKYGIHWPRLEGGHFKPHQMEVLTKMFHSLDFSKEENVRAYLEQKAIFLSREK